jgi:Lrp/AsnC family transcriptional regulator for asnA, asnC and gidA
MKPILDELDRKILSMLVKDASKPYTDVSKDLDVSGGTIHVRMKKLMESGVVLGTRLIIDPVKLGFNICAFLGIFLEKGSKYREVVSVLENFPEIVELHYTTGDYSIFAKVYCRDTEHLRQLLNEKIQPTAGVERTETFISLEQSILREIELF